MVTSSRGLPIIWRPTGRSLPPSLMKPQGTLQTGRRAGFLITDRTVCNTLDCLARGWILRVWRRGRCGLWRGVAFLRLMCSAGCGARHAGKRALPNEGNSGVDAEGRCLGRAGGGKHAASWTGDFGRLASSRRWGGSPVLVLVLVGSPAFRPSGGMGWCWVTERPEGRTTNNEGGSGESDV